jgi:hypothetical protein
MRPQPNPLSSAPRFCKCAFLPEAYENTFFQKDAFTDAR